MKERRVAIIVEFFLFLIGLLFIVLNYKNESEIHKDILIPIFLSILSGAFVAFCIELPRYILEHRMMLAYIIALAKRIEILLHSNISTIEEMGIKNLKI